MSQTKLANVFGEPGTGWHAIRVADIAIVDVASTVALAFVITRGRPTIRSIVYLFLMGIVAHRIFGVRTKVDRLLFG